MSHAHITLDAINHALNSMDAWPMSSASADIFDALYDAKVTCCDSIQGRRASDAGQAVSALMEQNARSRAALRVIDGGVA